MTREAYRLEAEDRCPHCDHHLAKHNEDGCTVGWRYREGISMVDGCMCNLRIAQ